MNNLNLAPQNPSLGNEGSKQTTHTILMIEPVAFKFNDQTSVNNHFQQKDTVSEKEIQRLALAEFNVMVDMLRKKGITAIVVKDTLEPHTPDSVFPNNWISFHGDGQAVLYPMFAKNRRKERRFDIIEYISSLGIKIHNIDDFTFWEEENLFLEGTGSMILDRTNKIAYAALSERTAKIVLLEFCSVFHYKPVYFTANQTVRGKRIPIYHTNVMMTVASEFAVICLDTIDNPDERKVVVDTLIKTGKDIITISEHQMNSFAGNMLQVENSNGKHFLVLSHSAFNSLNQTQKDRLASYNEFITVSIPTIERVGGGSVRCMMAEVF